MRIFPGLIFAALLLSASTGARADMAAGQQAYAAGEFLRAIQIWREEANAGDADAAWYVGNMYVDGLGIAEPDPTRAANFYQMAVDQDHVEAKVSLGLLYAQGVGVEEDYARAMALLYEAALAGHAVAQVELANYFLDGVPGRVEQSQGHAFEWYGLAARQGVVLAQMRYGQMNFQGIGAPEDQEVGLMWVGVAREIAISSHEPYWSYRVYPLDATIGAGDATLRSAVIALYDDYAAQVTDEIVIDARQGALVWIAEHSD